MASEYVKRRLMIALLVGISMAGGVSLILYYLSDNIVFFLTPSELNSKHYGAKIRLGGLVKEESITKLPTGGISFILTDGAAEKLVVYYGIVPALFREKQGMVAEGILVDDMSDFVAEQLLAKHDENYAPLKLKQQASGSTK